jgi:hypothetical protein
VTENCWLPSIGWEGGGGKVNNILGVPRDVKCQDGAFLYGYPKESVVPILIHAPTEASSELRLTRRNFAVIVICHSRRSWSRSDKEDHSNHSNRKKYYTHTKEGSSQSEFLVRAVACRWEHTLQKLLCHVIICLGCSVLSS